jgi:hypothetical protein
VSCSVSNPDGRHPFYPTLDLHLKSYFDRQRGQNYAVCYRKLKLEIERVRAELALPDSFKASFGYIGNWAKRYRIKAYRPTHAAQVDKRTPDELRAVIQDYLDATRLAIQNVDPDQVINMDQVHKSAATKRCLT